MFRGDNILTLTQTNTNTPLRASLAQTLNQLDFVEVASPEIYAFSYIINKKNGEYEPVLTRGVQPKYFLEIEKANMVEGGYSGSFMLIGESLSKRLGLNVGDSITITGSTTPAIIESTVSGIFSSETASNDQVLLPLNYARKLADLGEDSVIIIRVKTDDQEILIDFLTTEEYSVVVSGGGGTPISVNENKTYEEVIAEELAFKYLDPEKFSTSNESFVGTFVTKGAGTVSIVVLGFISLNALLTFVGITAILARGVIERRKDIGILAAIGADKKTIYKLLLKDLFIISVIAAGVGVGIGFITAQIVQDQGMIVAFGHVIQPAIDLNLFIVTFFVAIIIGCTSGLLVSSIILTAKPSSLMREIEEAEKEEEKETLAEAIGV
jgi:ABC-type lipoprotein release transport system permease subunit